MKKFKQNIASHMSTIIGVVMAVCEAWLTVDWKEFDVKKEWPKLLLSAAFAVGGYMTSINMLKPKNK